MTPLSGFAQSGYSKPGSTPSPSKLLGATFAPIPDLFYARFPDLPRGQGLVIEAVEDHSLAHKIGLRRHDILLEFRKTAVRDTKQLAYLLCFTPPNRDHPLGILRQGKPLTLTCFFREKDLPQLPKSLTKSSVPPIVSLEARPLEKGKLKVILTYYVGDYNNQQSITCTGSPEEIEAEVRQLTQQLQIPLGLRELVEVALNRFRVQLNANPSQ